MLPPERPAPPQLQSSESLIPGNEQSIVAAQQQQVVMSSRPTVTAVGADQAMAAQRQTLGALALLPSERLVITTGAPHPRLPNWLARLFPARKATTVNITIHQNGHQGGGALAASDHIYGLVASLRALTTPQVASPALDLYTTLGEDLDSTIRLCGQALAILNTRAQHDTESLSLACAALESLTAALTDVLQRYGLRILAANPAVSTVRLDNAVTMPVIRTPRRSDLPSSKLAQLAREMTMALDRVAWHLRRVQADLRSARGALADPGRARPGGGDIREADLFTVAAAINQLGTVTTDLYAQQTDFRGRLFEPVNPPRRRLCRLGRRRRRP